MSFRIAILTLVLFISLAACNSTTDRAGDVAPLQDNVPSETSAENNSSTSRQSEEGPSPTQNDAEAVMAFTIQGGVVGFCDELVIGANGDYVLNTCTEGQSAGTLSQSDRVSLKTWAANLTDFQIQADAAVEGADNLVVNLNFSGTGGTEADDIQKQVIYDWVNGLVVRLRPRPEIELSPVPEIVEALPGGLCPDINRPALMLIDFENPGTMSLMDVDSRTECDVTLGRMPFGRVVNAAGNIYYPVADSEAKTVVVWQVSATGEQKSLEFTAVTMEEPRPYGVAVSADGTKIAWSHTAIDLEAEPALYQNYLWIADIDGANLVTVLDGVESNESRFVSPIQFSTADNRFYYALQPDIGGPVFSGRLDTVYSVSAAGGEPELLYACSAEENPVCVTGVALDGSVFSIIDPTTDSIQILNQDSTMINSIPLPGTDYVEQTLFGSTGNLAFVSATLSEPASEEDVPKPDPGYITVMSAPYTEEAQTLLSDSSVGTLRGWVDENRLVFGSVDAEGNTGTALVTGEGQVTEVSSMFAVGVLQ